MINKNNTTAEPLSSPSLSKRMLLGAAIGLILILTFILPVKNPKPEWPSLWMLKPLIVVPLAGAAGGLFYHLMGSIRRQGGWKKVLINIACLIVYIFGLWIGIVLGLNGTLWN